MFGISSFRLRGYVGMMFFTWFGMIFTFTYADPYIIIIVRTFYQYVRRMLLWISTTAENGSGKLSSA